jgi:tellurium resistance protein TerD
MPDIHFECPKCKQSLEAPSELANELIECPTCKETIEVPARTRLPISQRSMMTKQPPLLEVLPPVIPQRMDNRDDPVRCPKCQSSQIAANKKGFGLGKAAVGGILLGPVGLLGGMIGGNKIAITCLKCGNVFEPGNQA